MSKRSFNDIEQIIKKVTEGHEPAFNEQAWAKMETLLNKEDDRRRPFVFWLWWLLPLVLGTVATGYYMIDYTLGTKQEVVQVNSDVPEDYNEIAKAENNQPSQKTTPGNSHSNGPVSVDTEPETEKLESKRPASGKTVSGIIITSPGVPFKDSREEGVTGKKPHTKKTKAKMAGKVSAPNAVVDETDQMNTGHVAIASTKKADDKLEASESNDVIVIVTDNKHETAVHLPLSADSVNEIVKSADQLKNKKARLYLIAVVGAEGNGVKLFAADKITTRVGLSMGYRVNKRLDIQTGFYSSSKKYVAGANDYKTKPGTYWNAVDMQWIDASCRVYEIPVSVIYHFNPGKKNALFASAGLSSYLMKKEDYHMYYEHYGLPREAEVSYTGNKSLFSVLRLAGGIERKISDNFSLQVSPGLAIPLGGVGEGEVKLFSADISIGLKYAPKRKN